MCYQKLLSRVVFAALFVPGSIAWADSFQVGPVFSTGIPHPIDAGAEAKVGKDYGGQVTGGVFSYAMPDTSTVKDGKITITHFEAQGNYFVFGEAFYVGAGLGYQKINAKAQNASKVKTGTTESDVEISADLSITSYYLPLHLGWIWYLDMGLGLGVGLGLNVPFYSSADFSADFESDPIVDSAVKQTQAYQTLEDDVKTAGRKAGRLALPYLQILRISYLF